MSKRANGEGTVYQRKDGRWAAQLSAQGKPLYRYAKTKVEASKKLQILRSERDRGELAGTGDVSVSDWAVEWLEFKKSRVKPTTLVKYERDLRVNVIPYLGRVRLKNLNTKHVSNLHSTLLNKGQKPRTVLHVHRVLRTMLQDAMAGEMIHKNVASLVSPPSVPTSSHNILDKDGINRLLNALFNVQDRSLIRLALVTGMRSGEILALRWQDIDLTENILSVEHTINFLGGGHFVLGTPKTKSSRRKIKFQKMIAEHFKELRHYQDQQRELAGAEWDDSGFVFCNDFGRPLTQAGMPRQILYPALERGKVKRVRFQDLRHTCFSHMIAGGAVITDVSAIAGHANVSITMQLYAHALPDASDRVTAIMEELLIGVS